MEKKQTNVNIDNIQQIQQSIQSIVHDIEKEKINLRIFQERYAKKLREYNEILGKPVPLTKEQKLKRMKEKLESLKKRQIFSPNYGRKIRFVSPEDEIKTLKKSTSLNEIKLNDIKTGVNRQALINDRILNEINEIRRDKVHLQTKLSKIEEKNEEIEKSLEKLIKKNKENTKKLKYSDLKKSRNYGLSLEEKFKSDRDTLEDKFHKIIAANIRKERIRNSELSKQRLMNAAIADHVRKKTNDTSNQEKKEDQDDIQDRMPILDVLLEKWTYILKYKKNMINKYIYNSSQIKNTFDKLILFLGLEKYEELPIIYEKDDIQMAKIDELLSKTINDVDELKAKKELLEKQIQILSEKKNNDNINKEEYVKEKKSNVDTLKKLNDELVEEITKKRLLFSDMEESTFNFLKKMENTYLADFVVKKMNVKENSKLNENNVIDYLGSVYCYIQLINDFNDNVQNKKMLKENLDKSYSDNKNIDNLQKEIKIKLSKFSYNNCINKLKIDIKQKPSFDEIIKRLANDIVDEVNNNYDSYVELNTNQVNTDNKKSSKNLRYQQDGS